jgi:hypothetical protein
MLIEIWERLRGYDKWIKAEATVESSRVEHIQVRTGGYEQSDKVLLWTDGTGERHRAYLEVTAGSPLNNLLLDPGIEIRYDPADPDQYYLRELLKYRVMKATISACFGAVIAAAFVFLIVRIWISLNAKGHLAFARTFVLRYKPSSELRFRIASMQNPICASSSTPSSCAP